MLDKRAQARDSDISTLVVAIGDHSHATDDAVVLQGNEESGNLLKKDLKKERPLNMLQCAHTNCSNETDALYNYSLNGIGIQL